MYTCYMYTGLRNGKGKGYHEGMFSRERPFFNARAKSSDLNALKHAHERLEYRRNRLAYTVQPILDLHKQQEVIPKNTENLRQASKSLGGALKLAQRF